MYKLLMIFFICAFSTVMSCRDQDAHALKLGSTTLHIKDMRVINEPKESECMCNFIRGNYVEFSKNLKYCVYLGFDFPDVFENPAAYEGMDDDNLPYVFRNSDFGLFSFSSISAFSYLGLYNIIHKDVLFNGSFNELFDTECILAAKVWMDFYDCNLAFHKSLPYEMLLLRSAYLLGDVHLERNIVVNQIEKFLSFEEFYRDWDDSCEKHNNIDPDSHNVFYSVYPYGYDDALLKMANDLLREVHKSGGHVHDDFIRFKAAIDEGDLFKAICYEKKKKD